VVRHLVICGWQRRDKNPPKIWVSAGRMPTLQITQKCYGVQGNTWAKTQRKHQNYRGEGLKIYTVAGGGFASSVKLLIEYAVTSSLAVANKLLMVMVLLSTQLVRLFFNVLLARDPYTLSSGRCI